jgi:hypothetical protein
LPVGVPAPGATALTVAVKVTGWLETLGLADETTAAELLALVTFCVIPALLAMKLASPK